MLHRLSMEFYIYISICMSTFFVCGLYITYIDVYILHNCWSLLHISIYEPPQPYHVSVYSTMQSLCLSYLVDKYMKYLKNYRDLNCYTVSFLLSIFLNVIICGYCTNDNIYKPFTSMVINCLSGLLVFACDDFFLIFP